MEIEKFNAVIAELASRLGGDSDSYDECGVFELSLSHSDRLYIEQCESGAIVYFGREYKQVLSGQLVKILKACDQKNAGAEQLIAGMNGLNELMYIVKIPERDMTVQFLQSKLARLHKLHDALGAQTH